MMILLKTMTGIFLLTLPLSLYAVWNIETNGKKRIYVDNTDGHQLSIVANNNGVDFILSLQISDPALNPEHAIIRIGDLKETTGKLQLTEKKSGHQSYLLPLGKKQKTTLLNRMISDLVVYIDIEQRLVPPVKFSLVGFTASLNDFLIAKEIQKLDYEWLLEHHKDRELLCYYAANIYVKALLDRLAGVSYKKSLQLIPKTGIEKLDSVTGEMVQNVYSIPANQLPADPRGDKYGIFKACMSRVN